VDGVQPLLQLETKIRHFTIECYREHTGIS